ncbi:conserved exported hypothetical protein [Hyphomicrobium sp. GJ21]|uniref:hypothetical protein n=1 Tax=Hyphomicrobium sp. GJ21 TaxID=113574 RepID=UPI000622B4AF|nr:hypothetical protein [Hyphomicrobium sp. GJ21]CEJ83405.1 conserved exported hypothetical protein [Hyphomicrobium sp. GJ21]
MTRVSVNRTLKRLYWLLTAVLLLLLASKFADDASGLPPFVVSAANKVYDFMRDMSLLIATGGVAYLSNIFQKRSKFVESLEEEWRNIVRTKSALLSTCEKPYLATDDYLAAFYRISETIDTMRIVYKNSGETSTLVGLYPYAPLHDMRRALQTLDPRINPEATADQKTLVREAILQSFFALRETFLEELDLEEPQSPLLISGARRLKVPGADMAARIMQDHQRRRLEREPAQKPEVDAFLTALRTREEENERPQAEKPL